MLVRFGLGVKFRHVGAVVAAHAYARGVVFGFGGKLLESGFWGFGVYVTLFKAAGEGVVVLREASEEVGEVE